MSYVASLRLPIVYRVINHKLDRFIDSWPTAVMQIMVTWFQADQTTAANYKSFEPPSLISLFLSSSLLLVKLLFSFFSHPTSLHELNAIMSAPHDELHGSIACQVQQNWDWRAVQFTHPPNVQPFLSVSQGELAWAFRVLNGFVYIRLRRDIMLRGKFLLSVAFPLTSANSDTRMGTANPASERVTTSDPDANSIVDRDIPECCCCIWGRGSSNSECSLQDTSTSLEDHCGQQGQHLENYSWAP